MTSIKIVKFLTPPTPLVGLHPNFFHPLDLGHPISNEPPSTSPNNSYFSLFIYSEAAIWRCSKEKVFWNMQQIYSRTPMQKCDFNKVAKQLCWNRTLAWVFCKFAAYFQNTFSREHLWTAASVHSTFHAWIIYHNPRMTIVMLLSDPFFGFFRFFNFFQYKLTNLIWLSFAFFSFSWSFTTWFFVALNSCVCSCPRISWNSFICNYSHF